MCIKPAGPAICTVSLILMTALILARDVAAGPIKPKTGPIGVWLTQDRDAKVHVSQCGASICGEVVWLEQPLDSATGKPLTDAMNPDPSLKTRLIIGLQLFQDMLPTAPDSWSGRIYNAEDGKSYASTVTLLNSEQLEVRGCVGPLCAKETWTRAAR